MPVQPAALDLLTAVAPVLARWGRWYVFGAQAVIAYGVPRLSADVDITLQLVPDAPDRFVVDMDAAGFALRADDPGFVQRTRVLPFVHRATAMPLDVVLAGSGLEDEFLDRAQSVDVGGITVHDRTGRPGHRQGAGRTAEGHRGRALWGLRGKDLDAALPDTASR